LKKYSLLCIIIIFALTLTACKVTYIGKLDEKDNPKTNDKQKEDNLEKDKEDKKEEKKEDNKDKKASKALGAYRKFVKIYDESNGDSHKYFQDEKDVNFSYDLDLDGKEDNIKLRFKDSNYSSVYDLFVNDSKVEMVLGPFASAWAITLDGESIYLAFLGDSEHQVTLNLYQYKDNKLLEQGRIFVNSMKDNCPHYDANSIDSIVIEEDGSIEGIKWVDTIQCSHFKVKHKLDDSGKLIEQKVKKDDEVEFIENNDITLVKEIELYDKPNGNVVKKMSPQKFRIIKGIVENEVKSRGSISWCYIKGEKEGEEGWYFFDHNDYKSHQYFENMIIYD